MRPSLTILLLAVLLAAALAAGAQDDGRKQAQRAKELLTKLDTDKNGYVSKAEFGGDDWIFEQLDKNQDGKLDAKELSHKDQQARRPAPADRGKALFAEADKNGDGKLSLAEFTDHAFARRDVNKDGVITTADQPEGKMPGGPGEGMREKARERVAERVRERAGRALGSEYDKNNDGALSKEEFAAWQAEVFKKLDRNADGFLTPDEMPAPAGPMQGGGAAAADAGVVLKRMDSDGDGKISKEEWRGPEPAFKRLDRNADGFIDRQEIPQGWMGQRGGQAGRPNARQMLRRMDTDGDGAISREEWRGAPERFDRLDRNGDGVIDKNDRDLR